MAFEIVNILTFVGTTEDVEDIVRSFNVDKIDITTTLEPNKVRFYSDNNYPHDELIKVSKNFPNVTIKVEFSDEDLGYNVGTFKMLNGEIFDWVSPRGGSDEAYEMSIQITGDHFFVTDFLYGLEEDEITEEFPDMCIRLAFKMRLCNTSYPTYILEIFERMAVEVEDYEFASEVNKLIKLERNGTN